MAEGKETLSWQPIRGEEQVTGKDAYHRHTPSDVPPHLLPLNDVKKS